MKVILLKDVKKQGKKDDILDLKDGYAKFLISNKFAVLYTEKSLEVLNKSLDAEKELEEENIKEANLLKSKLEKERIVISSKSGENDKLFGSISSKNIVEELEKLGYKIDKRKVKMPEITTLGIYIIEVELYKKVIANLTIKVVKK